MPRANKIPFDQDAAIVELIELGVRRRQFIKARIRVDNAAGGLLRRALGFQPDLPDRERNAIAKKAAKIYDSEDFSELPDEIEKIARLLEPDIQTSRAMAAPAAAQVRQIEKRMRSLARQFPVWGWAEGIRGFSDLGLAIVIAEAGDLSKYSKHDKLWKRLGIAPLTKDGETRALSQWRMTKGGLTDADWKAAAYSPRRRAAVFVHVGQPIIGFMQKGYRPFVGEDVSANERLSFYERLFVERLRYEAARDPDMRRPDTKEGKESYSKRCASRAMRVVEQRLIKHLWQAWRRANQEMPQGARAHLPAEYSNAEQPADRQATNMMPPSARFRLPDGLISDAEQSAGRQAKSRMPSRAIGSSPDAPSPDAGSPAASAAIPLVSLATKLDPPRSPSTKAPKGARPRQSWSASSAARRTLRGRQTQASILPTPHN